MQQKLPDITPTFTFNNHSAVSSNPNPEKEPTVFSIHATMGRRQINAVLIASTALLREIDAVLCSFDLTVPEIAIEPSAYEFIASTCPLSLGGD
jgi:hypothetical protein